MYFVCISFGLSEVTWLKSECFMESLMKCATRKNRMMFLISFKFVCTSLFGVQEKGSAMVIMAGLIKRFVGIKNLKNGIERKKI